MRVKKFKLNVTIKNETISKLLTVEENLHPSPQSALRQRI